MKSYENRQQKMTIMKQTRITKCATIISYTINQYTQQKYI